MSGNPFLIGRFDAFHLQKYLFVIILFVIISIISYLNETSKTSNIPRFIAGRNRMVIRDTALHLHKQWRRSERSVSDDDAGRGTGDVQKLSFIKPHSTLEISEMKVSNSLILISNGSMTITSKAASSGTGRAASSATSRPASSEIASPRTASNRTKSKSISKNDNIKLPFNNVRIPGSPPTFINKIIDRLIVRVKRGQKRGGMFFHRNNSSILK